METKYSESHSILHITNCNQPISLEFTDFRFIGGRKSLNGSLRIFMNMR